MPSTTASRSKATSDTGTSAAKQALVQRLPHLRRYARALTGSQQIGDDYVRGCLETLVQEPELLRQEGDIGVTLFKVFHRFAHAVETSTDDLAKLGDPIERRIGERLVALAPRDRQALLLVHQEGFTQAQAAEIFGVDEAEVAKRLDKAWSELKRQPTTRILIIEDEPVIALDVAQTVTGLGHEVTAIASRASEAIAEAKKTPPGLILADIQLEDGSSGITAVQEILKSSDVPVIFVTAFPERLLTGEMLEPAFVVTKPFDATTLKVAISQALFCAQPAAAKGS
jgi:CheY-like chemotaxis protein/DNA-directed RNA polymerase specialized sigma24 family protein